ncbi:MAG TPA: hypothetical protein VEB69_12245 [Acidimicrobiia bacterium]|nr:hypothetical protein [Acidimicrobiia bacterium]
MRWIAGVLIAIALGVGVFLLWPRSSDDPPADTIAAGTSTTTASTSESSSTTSTRAAASTTDEGGHVVETVEEAEEILRQLWFGWFEGIYNQDEDRIREVVATQQMLKAATEAFGTGFESPPSVDAIVVEVEILRSDRECLVTYGSLDVSAFRGPGSQTESVQVLRNMDGEWRFATSWVHPDDLWEADCESELQPLS